MPAVAAPPDVKEARRDLHNKLGRSQTKVQCSKFTKNHSRCPNNAVVGSQPPACTMHGGNLASTARSATKRAQQDWLRLQAKRHLLKYHGIEFTEEPLEGILGEVATSAGMVKAYEELISAMAPQDPMFFALIELYNQERDRHVKFAKTAIDGNVAERQMALSEGLAGVCMTLLVNVLLDPELGLDARVAEKGRKLYADRLNELLGKPVANIPEKAPKALTNVETIDVLPVTLERPE